MTKDSGKIKSLNRWKEREARGIKTALDVLSHTIQVAPLQDGRISVQLGLPGEMGIHFVIPQNMILDAAQAGITFAEELAKKKLTDDNTEASTQPARSE